MTNEPGTYTFTRVDGQDYPDVDGVCRACRQPVVTRGATGDRFFIFHEPPFFEQRAYPIGSATPQDEGIYHERCVPPRVWARARALGRDE